MIKKDNLYLKIKPIIDFLIALVLFIFSLPIGLIISLLIKLDSPGPIIFSQKRIGKDKKLFRFYKFRTMKYNSKKLYPKLYEYKFSRAEIKTMTFKIKDDPRLTTFGRRLRTTSLDEIPNLINVLKGEMSLVGPRPEIPEMLAYYTKEQMNKFSVMPGVTGLAQANGRGFLTFQKTIELDLKYIQQRSFKADFLTLLKTIKIVFRAFGAF